VFGKEHFRPTVTFDDVGEWSRHRDNTVSYVVAADLPITSRDWIGFYAVSDRRQFVCCTSLSALTSSTDAKCWKSNYV